MKVKHYKISELAAVTGVSTHTVRNYVQERLLCCVGHTPGGYALYDQACIERLRFIRAARKAGLLIIDIKPLIYALNDGENGLTKSTASELKVKVTNLKKHLSLFTDLLEQQAKISE
ncbi:MerR family transcriptional regulator [Aliikangiella sp. IMCC44359]|uniref:MerR family transcriptional regulator n=1 Tax=Aliikangiella sp. IMCC44359 TaxID=3459125 RepID=UPI00403A9F69